MSREPEPDERRVRHLLARLGARPIGHSHDAPKRTPMTDQPITPTRIIPAGAPLPARAPEPGENPPWRTPPPPPPPVIPPATPPPPPPPGPIEVRVIVDLAPLPEPEPEPSLRTRAWNWLWERLCTWRMLLAILAALLPWANGQSPVGVWSHTVHQARTEAGIGAAYIIAGVAFAAAWALDWHTGKAFPRFLLVTATLGALGVLNWWDPILMLTGVHRS